MRSSIIGRSKTGGRESWWYLHQSDDGSLWVSYDNDDDDRKGWTKPLQEVLASGPESARTHVEAWIGKTLAKKDAKRA